MAGFSLEQRDLDPGYCEISVEGELDLAVAGELDEAIAGVDAGYVGLVVGLAACEFIDSTGIAVILRARRRFVAEGRRLVVCCPADQVERILAVTGLSRDGLVYESLDDALAALRPDADG
ncbi:MAG TPA: STAS domain-containing protein [Solirubrobacterales bacterium]|nr:STAS domain-containing protein [Solirubrobacterales bacterium]